MSKSEEKASKKEQDGQEKDSVFDFLYHDSRRIASFLSQFDNNGLLTGLTQGESASKGAKRGKKIGLGGNTPLGGGSVEFEVGPGESGSESLERTYDPFWSNAREFLDAATERDLIQRDITKANIGQFVLVSGSLIVVDMKMLQAVWETPVLKKFMKDASQQTEEIDETLNRQQRKEQQALARKRKKEEPEITEADLAIELLPHMPHSAQFNIVNSENAIWGSVEEDALVVSLADLILKHGAKIAGQWSMLGILDALPWEENEMMTAEEMVAVGMTAETMTNVPLTLAPIIRNILGRPLLSYGMTPLMVFRELST